jgi:hypothetical protein
MGERAQKVVIRDGRVTLYRDRWGGQSSIDVLRDGPTGLQNDLAESSPNAEWWDPAFAEGGYLVDFDRKCILLYSWDAALAESCLSVISSAWPGWSVTVAPEGVPDFQAHVSSLPSPGRLTSR